MNSKTKISVYLLSSIFILTILLAGSCKKANQLTQAKVQLQFSADTLLFDTLFTTIGSSTHTLLVTNNESQAVNISQIYLANGSQSKYRMNVDGISGYSVSDVRIEAHDSIYIFVEVTIDPNSATGPMLVTDSIIFNTNGNIQDVDLIAYGRDAYFILPNKHINGLPPFNIVAGENTDTTWTNDKPIVIYGYAVVDSTATLHIQEGTQIYFHKNSGLWIYKGGCLKVMGTKDNPVSFEGDRPEDYYKNLPGQWDRIWINEGSVDNEINYAIIKNGFIGIQAEILQQAMGNKIKINNTIIENMSGVGILSKAYSIEGKNLLIANCKQYNLALTMGGSYDFSYCSIANYWNYSLRKTPAVYLNNYYMDANKIIYPFDLIKANFYNCIIVGSNTEELVLDDNAQGGNFNYLFDHALLKTQHITGNTNYWKAVIKNEDPDFINEGINNYHLGAQSAAIGKAKAGVLPLLDLDGVSRNVANPDLGVYEYVP